MVPLAASSTGLAVMGVVIVGGLVAAWLLLRAESREDQARKAEQKARGEVDPFA